jgi:formylmethanofuran dehydrogenase subunit B
MWRKRTDQELKEIQKELDIVIDGKMKTVEWTGHVMRMDQSRTVKKIVESKPEGSRRERSGMRWLEDVEKKMRETKVTR